MSAPLWVAWRLTRRGWESVSSHDDPATLDELVRSRYGAACRVVVTYEREVPVERERAAISRLFVDDTVQVEGGAAPTAMPGLYEVDRDGLGEL